MATLIFGFPKDTYSVTTPSQSAFEFECNFRHLKFFIKLATKVAINVLLQIKITNKSVHNVTDIPTVTF